MNQKLECWLRTASAAGDFSETLSEHLDYFGFPPTFYQDLAAIQDLFLWISSEVARLHVPAKVMLTCPLKESVSAYTRPIPSLDQAWQHARFSEPPSIHLVPRQWCLAKLEVVEARVFFPVSSTNRGVYLRTFRRIEEPDEETSYDTALYFETFEEPPKKEE